MSWNKLYFLIFISVAMCAMMSCNDSGTNSGDHSYSGITMTNVVGDILSIDIDDWGCSDTIPPPKYDMQPLDILPTVFCFGPAYPNPSTGPVSIIIAVPVTSSTRVWVTNGRDFTVELLNDTLEAGVHEVVWNSSGAEVGIYRAFLETEFWQRYGDISIR